MNALVRKEVRMLLPMWAGAMMLVLGAICLSPARMVGPLLASSFAVGSILLALVPFGLECGWGTFSNLLSQPVARARIWRLKTRVLGVGLGLVFALFLAGIGLREAGAMGRPSASGLALFGGMTVVAAASGGLWTTLLFRQMAAAFWFTLLLPLFILMTASGVLDRLGEPAASSVAVGILLVYSIAGFWFARHQFLRAQDTQWTGGSERR